MTKLCKQCTQYLDSIRSNDVRVVQESTSDLMDRHAEIVVFYCFYLYYTVTQAQSVGLLCQQAMCTLYVTGTCIANLYASQCRVLTARGTILREGEKKRIEERGRVNGAEVTETAS